MDGEMIGSLALFVISMGLFQELQRNLIIRKRENGEEASWGLAASLLTFFMCIFPLSAIVVIIYSIMCLYRMGCDVKLCLWMPKELNASSADSDKLKRLKNRAEKIQEAREKIVQDLKDKKPDEPKK